MSWNTEPSFEAKHGLKLTSFSPAQFPRDAVVVIVHAGWCPHCVHIMEDVVPRLRHKYDDKIRTLCVADTPPPGDDLALSFSVLSSMWPFALELSSEKAQVGPITIETGALQNMIKSLFNIEGYPTIFVIDHRHGTVYKMEGFREYKVLKRIVKHYSE